MSKRGENIYKRKDGRWEGRYVKCRTLHGKIQYGYIYGKSYSETKAKLKENASTPIRASSSQATQSALYDEVLKAWLLSSKNRVNEIQSSCCASHTTTPGELSNQRNKHRSP